MKHSMMRNLRSLAVTPPMSRILLGNAAKSKGPELRKSRLFHSSIRREAVIPYLLADIGEGITECQIMEWFVEPGARVEQFDRICEVQSDKASVEITSRFDGVITALHYAQDDMAIVGKPLIDIDVDISVEEADAIQQPIDEARLEPEKLVEDDIQQTTGELGLKTPDLLLDNEARQSLRQNLPPPPPSEEQLINADVSRGVTTPGVRHLLKEHNIDVNEVKGTGKDGRVRKEDIERFLASRSSTATALSPSPSPATPLKSNAEDKVIPLTATENQMFKVMTNSLQIPHFLYTHAVDITSINNVRKRFNDKAHLSSIFTAKDSSSKLSSLPFIMKALSHVLTQFPKVNAHLDISSPKPQLILKASHNFGLAIDTPQGLLVPVVKDVQNHSITSLALEIKRLSDLAQAGKLSPSDFKGATISISNIGSIGGGVVSPVIVSPMVAIIGVGRAKEVPVFEKQEDGIERLVKREEVTLSWSADHRVLDGATVARCAETVSVVLENMDFMGAILK